MQTLFASFAAFVSLVVLREFQPWLKDSDDVVAHAAQCLVFCWLFALQAYDALRTIPRVKNPNLVWATPLTILTVTFVGFSIKKGHEDFTAVEQRRAGVERDVLATRPKRRNTRRESNPAAGQRGTWNVRRG